MFCQGLIDGGSETFAWFLNTHAGMLSAPLALLALTLSKALKVVHSNIQDSKDIIVHLKHYINNGNGSSAASIPPPYSSMFCLISPVHVLQH